MRKSRSFLLFMFAAVLALVSTASGATYTVTMTSQNRFSPAVTNILVGDTVVWVNAGFVQHTVTPTNNSEAFCGTTLLDRCEYTFTRPGSFPYYCIPHFRPPFQTMTGLVVVASPPNIAPTVTISSPANGAGFAAPASFQITANANDIDGTVTGVEFFVNNQSIGIAPPPNFAASVSSLGVGNYTLTAIATDNSGANSASASVSITVTQATIVLPRYPLAVSVSPANSGGVSAQPPQPENGYESNTLVTLTASATDGFSFQSWSGDVSSVENPVTVTMDSARSVTANFAPIVVPTRSLVIETNPSDGGTVNVSPAPNGPNSTYVNGTVVTITATAAFAFAFSNWSGAASVATNPLVIVMDSDKTIVANFLSTPVITHTLTLVTNPFGAGLISVSPPPNAPGGAYIENTVVTLVATPLTTNAFTNWTGDVASDSNHITITMDADKTATANFVPILFRLTVTASPTNGGRVLVNPLPGTNGTYGVGTLVALAAVPDRGFHFVRWDGAIASSNNPVVITINSDTVAIALFEPDAPADFSVAAGTYIGLLWTEHVVDHAASGTMNIRVSKTGAYRGTALVGGMRQNIAGHFDRFGYAPLVIRRGSLSGSLLLDPEFTRITGLLTDGTRSPALLLYRNEISTNASNFAGTYRVTFGTNGPVTSEGAATMVILSDGTARIRGELADGAKFSQRSFIAADSRIPLSVVLYNRGGSLLGWLNFATNGAVEGSALWSRPTDSRNDDFPAGLAIEIPISGAKQ